MTTTPVKQRLFLLDDFKLFASFFVVFIHCTFPGNFGIAVKAVARFGVPFFFLCSGYFLYQNTGKRILKKAFHIATIFTLTSLVYILLDIVHIVAKHNPAELSTYFLRFTKAEWVRRFILFNLPFMETHLWYLLAMVYVYCMFFVIKKLCLPDWFISMTSFFLLIIHMLIWHYLVYWDPATQTYVVRNFLFLGYPLTGIGYILRKHQKKLPVFSNTSLFLLLGTGSALCIISRFAIGNKSLPLGALISSVVLFIFCVTRSQPEKPFVKNAGSYSTFIYLFHPLVLEYYSTYISKTNITHPVLSYLTPIFVCILSTILAVLCTSLQKKAKTIFCRHV